MKNKGFSLVEVLVGTVIVISATTIVLSIIISSFRISSKTTANSVLRQNGNYALSQATRMIQFADKFESVVGSAGTLTSCTTTPPLAEYRVVNFIYDGAPASVSCTANGIQINNVSSIDTNKVKPVLNTCKFTCTQVEGEGPMIGINFSLAVGAGEVVEKSSSMNFSTKIKMRNN